MATETLISKSRSNRNRSRGSKANYPDADRSALEYEKGFRAILFQTEGWRVSGFDLVLAGMGNEGHTLSLFPGTKACMRMGASPCETGVAKLYAERITLTAPGASNAARSHLHGYGRGQSSRTEGRGWKGRLSRNNYPRNCSSRENGKTALAGRDTAAGSHAFRLNWRMLAVLRSRLVGCMAVTLEPTRWRSHLKRGERNGNQHDPGKN